MMRKVIEESANWSKGWWIVSLTFLVGMILTIMPLPYWAIWFRPDWVLLVVIYWTLTCPDEIGVGIAWLVGLLLDILLASMLGEHALAFALVGYFCIKFHLRIHSLFFWRKTTAIFLLILLYKSVLFWAQGFIGQLPDYRIYWLSTVTSLLAWPWVFILLRDSHNAFRLPAKNPLKTPLKNKGYS